MKFQGIIARSYTESFPLISKYVSVDQIFSPKKKLAEREYELEIFRRDNHRIL